MLTPFIIISQILNADYSFNFLIHLFYNYSHYHLRYLYVSDYCTHYYNLNF